MKEKIKVNLESNSLGKGPYANRNALTILINLYLQNKDVTVKR